MRLFSPLAIGPLVLRNRIVLSPMTTGFGFQSGVPDEDLLAYFRARTGGVAMAVVAFGAVRPEGRVEDQLPWLWQSGAAAALAPLAAAIRERGALACLQLGHGGRQVSPRVTGEVPVAPSPVPPAVHVDVPPRPLTTGEAEDVIVAFGQGAAVAAEAGFDAVEVHAAHGYLIQQFLSADANRREDRFGGATVAERSRFAVEVVQAVTAAAPGLAVLVRLNGDDLVPGGLTRTDTAITAGLVEQAGAHAIVVSSGVYGSVPYTIPLLDDAEGTFLPAAAHVRRAVGIPVIGVGRISAPRSAEAALARGDCDAVAVARALLADPEWVEKAAAGDDAAIRPCIATVQGCAGMLQHSGPISCQVNPDVGREALPRPSAAARPLRVTVVGGGVAGMEAARRAAELGHAVVLFEREAELGGALRLSARTPPLGHFERLLAWYLRELEGLEVEVHREVEASGTNVAATAPDHVVVAVGGRTEVPEVDGWEHLPAWPVEDALAGAESTLGTTTLPARVVISGGGQRALAAALWAAHRGSVVTVLSGGPLGADTSGLARRAYLGRLDRLGVPVLRGRLTALHPAGVSWRDGDTAGRTDADAVILAGRARPERWAAATTLTCPTTVIGDAKDPRDIASAVEEARAAADTLE